MKERKIYRLLGIICILAAFGTMVFLIIMREQIARCDGVVLPVIALAVIIIAMVYGGIKLIEKNR